MTTATVPEAGSDKLDRGVLTVAGVVGMGMTMTQGTVPASRVPAGVLAHGQSALATAFGHTYLVALVLIACCLIPALFMPRRKIVREPAQQQPAVEATMH